MKIWNGYGSEHSSNLVMVGKFKSVEDAEKAKELLDTITESLYDLVDADFENKLTRYSDEVSKVLQEHNLYIFNPDELEQFRLDIDGYFCNFIKENGACISHLHEPGFIFFSLGMSSFHIAKKFAFKQCFRYTSTIYGNKR